MIERGIVVGGRVIPGTDWCLRDSDAWWGAGERGVTRRDRRASILLGHWTAGNDHDGPVTASRVVRAMKARRRPDGAPLAVAIHFVIAAGTPDTDHALVWQTCDLALAATHVGSRGVNAGSIGVEVVSPGTVAQAARLGGSRRPVVEREIAGDRVHALALWRSQLCTWIRLADTVAALDGDETGIAVARCVPLDRDGALLADRFSPARQRSWSGAQEHLHVPGTRKADAATLLIGSLHEHGWPGIAA